MPLPSKSFLRGSDYHSDKLWAVPARPYLRLTQHEPSPLCACGAWSIYFLGKKIGSHGVILSSCFPQSITFRHDFQMVLEKKKLLDAQPSCPACLVVRRVGEQRGKMGFVPHVKKQGGWIQLAEQRGFDFTDQDGLLRGQELDLLLQRCLWFYFTLTPRKEGAVVGAEPAALWRGQPRGTQQVSIQLCRPNSAKPLSLS